MLYADTLRVLRAPVTDDGRSPGRDWDNAAEHYVYGVMVQPVTSAEIGDLQAEATDSIFNVFGQRGRDLDILASDRIGWSGVGIGGEAIYTVEGDVNRWRAPMTGLIHHCELVIKRVT